ncbi:MAG: DNA repair exonuclease [Candidatus Diapherotrites archaeon]|nr:DNA repair exonuclease [Candidatus Diapherotrites archaeon]
MKLLFLSDTHLGFGRRHRDYPERREDAYRGFKNALKIAVDESVDLILHAGDFFDSVRPSFETLSEAVELLTSLPPAEGIEVTVRDLGGKELFTYAPARIPLIAVHGNHDWNQNRENNIYTLLERAGLLVYAHRRIVEIRKGDESICVVGMGWIPDKYVERVISSYSVAPCDRSYFLFHQPVKGLYPSNPREKLLPPSLFPPGYGLYLGGHLHWIVDKEVAGKRFLIPGSTVITSLKEGEMDRPRIVYLIDGSAVRPVEIPGVRRAFLVEASSLEEAIKKIEELLAKPHELPPIVKVVLEGERREEVDVEQLRELFKGKALIYVFDRRRDSFFERIRSVKHEVSAEAFGRDLVFSILREKMGEDWEDWMEKLLNLLMEGKDDEALNFLLRGDLELSPSKEKVEKPKGGILDWVEG